jgi:hypothetical protein
MVLLFCAYSAVVLTSCFHAPVVGFVRFIEATLACHVNRQGNEFNASVEG